MADNVFLSINYLVQLVDKSVAGKQRSNYTNFLLALLHTFRL